MRRRDFIAGLGAAVWPLAARAQRAAKPVIGFLNTGTPDALANQLRAFHKGLGDAGFVEGHNVSIEYRWAEGQYDRLPGMAADLVQRQVTVIVTNGVSIIAAKAATTTIPIVFCVVAPDPVQAGLVASLDRPDGNVTGVNSMNFELESKRLQLLHEVIPDAREFGFLVNRATNRLGQLSNPGIDDNLTRKRNDDVRGAAHTLGLQVHVVEASTESALDEAFAKLIELRAGGLVIGTDPFFFSRVSQIATLALRHRIPTIYQYREFAAAGGLMSYAAAQADQYRIGGGYVGRILKGESPANLPVLRATKFDLIINMRTAKTLPCDPTPKDIRHFAHFPALRLRYDPVESRRLN
jgi:putative tryptophan/tyrosine transport system substrate-binding protein